MDKLKDIAKLLKKKEFKQLNTFFNKKYQTSNAQKLFKGIIEDKYKNDSQASFDIFGEKTPNKKYHELKNYVKEQMLDTVLTLDISINASDRLKATYKCEKYLFIGKILVKNGSYKASYDILKRCLLLAQRYSLTEIILSTLKYISNYYLFTGNKKELEKTLNEINIYKDIYSAELLSSEYLYKIKIKYSNSKSLKIHLANDAEKYSKKIYNLVKKFKKFNSLILNTNYFRIKCLAFESKGEFHSVIKFYSKIENYLLKNLKIISPFLFADFLLNKLLCYVYLQDYKNGLFLAERISQILPKNSVNFLIYLNHYFLLTIQSNKLEHSLEVLNKIENHSMFIFYQFEKEIFILFKSYLIFALLSSENTGLIDKGVKLMEGFDVLSHIKKIKTLKGDIKGLNVSILIIEFLFNLIGGNYDEIIKRMESLQQYSFRHLRKDNYYRMDCFIKLLLQVYLNEFKVNKIEDKSQSLLTKLKKFRTMTSNSFYNWEIISYEDLWEKVIKILRENQKNKFNQTN